MTTPQKPPHCTTSSSELHWQDARLQKALEHAPDVSDPSIAPSSETRQVILKAARQAIAKDTPAIATTTGPWAKRLWSFLFQGSYTPWNAAFATLLIAGFVGLLWTINDPNSALNPANPDITPSIYREVPAPSTSLSTPEPVPQTPVDPSPVATSSVQTDQELAISNNSIAQTPQPAPSERNRASRERTDTKPATSIQVEVQTGPVQDQITGRITSHDARITTPAPATRTQVLVPTPEIHQGAQRLEAISSSSADAPVASAQSQAPQTQTAFGPARSALPATPALPDLSTPKTSRDNFAELPDQISQVITASTDDMAVTSTHRQSPVSSVAMIQPEPSPVPLSAPTADLARGSITALYGKMDAGYGITNPVDTAETTTISQAPSTEKAYSASDTRVEESTFQSQRLPAPQAPSTGPFDSFSFTPPKPVAQTSAQPSAAQAHRVMPSEMPLPPAANAEIYTDTHTNTAVSSASTTSKNDSMDIHSGGNLSIVTPVGAMQQTMQQWTSVKITYSGVTTLLNREQVPVLANLLLSIATSNNASSNSNLSSSGLFANQSDPAIRTWRFYQGHRLLGTLQTRENHWQFTPVDSSSTHPPISGLFTQQQARKISAEIHHLFP